MSADLIRRANVTRGYDSPLVPKDEAGGLEPHHTVLALDPCRATTQKPREAWVLMFTIYRPE